MGFLIDEIDISQVNEKACSLPQNKDRVGAVEGVDKQDSAACNREPPEQVWHNTLFGALRGQPLDQKPTGKEGLPQKADDQPEIKIVQMFA